MKYIQKRWAIILMAVLMGLSAMAEPAWRFYVYNAASGLADNSAQTINCTKTGRLVITTMGQINFYDGQQFTYIDPTTENTYPLQKYNGHAHLYFDRYHHIWLKKRRSLTCVNLTREQFVGSIVEEFSKLGFQDQVYDMFVSDDLTVWVLTDKGLQNSERDLVYSVRSGHVLQDLHTYDDKYLLLFYETGQVDFLELSTGSVVFSEQAYSDQMAQKYAETSVARRIGNSFYQIRNGKGGAALLRFDVGAWKWETLLETPYYMSGIVEHDSLIYVPTAYGYWTYNPATGATDHIERLIMANGQELLTDINCMEFDKQGGLWIGTEKRGLLYARPLASPFSVYPWTNPMALQLAQGLDQHVKLRDTYREKSVNCVFTDSRGWDWVGTSTGLQLYRARSAKLPQLITRNEGLLNNVIHCIAEDQLHNIWVGTSYGICCLVVRDGKVRYVNRYNQWDGIPSESFVNGRSMLMDDGTVVMQALDHVIAFNPSRMQTLSDSVYYEIYPKLVRLYVNGNDVKTGDAINGNVILERALTRTRDINLNYNQNSVSLTFSGLNYFRPQQTYYRVRMSGPDQDERWRVFTPYDGSGQVDRNGLLHLPLPSMAPGSYKIEVQASMLPDDWRTTPYEWNIYVNEPWWRTTGVIALLGLVLLVLLCVYLYLWMKNANMRARRNSEEQGIIKRIKAFADRCDVSRGVLLEPIAAELTVPVAVGSMGETSEEFVRTMSRILPVVQARGRRHVSMRELSTAAGMNLPDFYALITSNIYKNPRPVVMQIMLGRAAEMLKAVPQKDIADIAAECGFASPNFFIASFFRRYRQLPTEYRNA